MISCILLPLASQFVWFVLLVVKKYVFLNLQEILVSSKGGW